MRSRYFSLVRMTPDAPFYDVEYYVLVKKAAEMLAATRCIWLSIRAPTRAVTLRCTVAGICDVEAQENQEVGNESSSAV